MIVYVDTSTVVPLMKAESTTAAVRDYLGDLQDDGHALVSAHLLETELHRVARRSGVSEEAATAVLARLTLAEMTRSDYRGASAVGAPDLGTLDALHLQVAVRIGVDAMLTFDERLAASAVQEGIPVLDPLTPRARPR